MVRAALAESRASFLVFCLVGAATAAIYFLSLAMLLEMFGLRYRVAVTLSYFLGISCQFLLNKLVTFKDRNFAEIVPQMLRYALVVVANYALTMLVVVFTVETLGLAPYVGVLFSVGLTVVSGFLLSKYWTFRRLDG